MAALAPIPRARDSTAMLVTNGVRRRVRKARWRSRMSMRQADGPKGWRERTVSKICPLIAQRNRNHCHPEHPRAPARGARDLKSSWAGKWRWRKALGRKAVHSTRKESPQPGRLGVPRALRALGMTSARLLLLK